jgi:hypothetical protein
VYLDGDVFGRPDANGRVELRLPSGDRRRGGDFDMWFWLMPAGTLPPALNIEVTVTAIPVGSTTIHSISGTVRDRSGAVISGATVTLTGPGNPQTAVTNTQGQFAFPNVVPGSYVVTVRFNDLAAEAPVTVPGTSGPIPPTLEPTDIAGRRLNEVRGLGPTFIARLEANGITHPAEVVALEPMALMEILRVPESRARTIIAEARRLLAE